MMNNIFETWTRLSKIPGGRFIFSKGLGRLVPYTGTVNPEIVEMRAGYVKTRMKDRRIVRNHLNSIHAMALANFAEATSGLAVMSGLGADMRAILVGFKVEYLKKARGTLNSECTSPDMNSKESRNVEVSCELKNEKGEVVTRATAIWRVGPMKK